jgi:hypothetical protein
MVPGEEADDDFPTTSIVLLSVEGVACTDMYLYPPILRPARKCAGNAHRPGCVVKWCKLRAGMRGIVKEGRRRANWEASAFKSRKKLVESRIEAAVGQASRALTRLRKVSCWPLIGHFRQDKALRDICSN